MQNKKIVLFSIVGFVAVFVIAALLLQKGTASSGEKVDRNLLVKEYSYVKGNKEAKVEIVEFFDPACGTCAQFHFFMNDLLKDYEGKIKVVHRYAPFHQNSVYAVKMLEGAKEQGLYFETLEFMFKTQAQWIDGHIVNPRKLWSLLPNVKGLDMKELASSMENPDYDELIKQEIKDIETLNVTKTPTYFVNQEELKDFGSENLVKLIESKL